MSTDTDEFADAPDDRTFRERVAEHPQPAALWLAGAVALVLLELGRAADGLLKLGETVRFLLGGIAAGPGWAADRVGGALGSAAGTLAAAVVALLLLALAALLLKAIVPWSIVDRYGVATDRSQERRELIERAIVTGALAVVAVLLVATPLRAVADAVAGSLTGVVESAAELPTLTGRETIPNEGHRTPEGGWEGTFLGLSPAWAWALRVFVVYAYAFLWLAWLWKGYTTFREHYREADWTPRDDSVDRFRGHYWGIFGLCVVFLFVVMALWAPALGPVSADANLYSPYQHEFEYFNEESNAVETISHGSANIDARSQGGDQNIGPLSYDQYDRWHPMGTNQDGKDLFTFLVYGARTSLVIALTAIGLATIFALAMSLVTAYYKGLVDVLTVVTSDTIISIPLFLLVLLLSVIFQQANHPIAAVYDGGLLLALIFAFVYWPTLWRSIRGPSLQVAEQEWVDAAKSYGQTPAMTMRKHMAPYVMSYIMIYASLLLGGVIIVTAALSFLGLGINPPTPEWGRMVNQGRSYVSTASWHISTLPGIMVVLVVTGFNALGDGIRDAMDPESAGGEETDAGAAATGGGG